MKCCSATPDFRTCARGIPREPARAGTQIGLAYRGVERAVDGAIGGMQSPLEKAQDLNTTRTSVPSPSFELSDSFQSYKLQICLTIARPSPVPPVRCERLFSTR